MPNRGQRHIGNAPQQSLGNEIEGWIPKRVSQGYGYHIAVGNEPGSTPFGAYGKHVASGATDDNVLWANGTWYIQPPEGTQISIVSSSLNDTALGTGARSLHIHYLDSGLNPKTETIAMNGILPVNTQATDIRFIQCAHVSEFGSLKKADGDITFYNTAVPTEVYNKISAGSIRCSSSVRRVPKGKRCIVIGMAASAISGTSASGVIVSICTSRFYESDFTEDAILVPQASIAMQDGGLTYTLPVPIVASEGELIGMKFSTDKGAIITGDWFGWIEDEQ